MKAFLKKNKIPVIIISVLLITAAAVAVCFAFMRNSQKEPTDENQPNAYEFNFYQCESKQLENPSDVGVMILDCDDKASFGNLVNGNITRKQGTYVQGTGALMIGSLRKISYASAFFKSTNISEYTDGSIHVSFFVNDPEKVGSALTLEITSAGTYDQQELSWDIPSAILQAGWNEVYLGIADARVTGEVNFQALNFFRLRASEGEVGLELIMDNVYASHTEATKLGIKGKTTKASTKTGYIMDCDTLDGLSTYSGCILAVNESECKEGTGSIAMNGLQSVAAYLTETDISGYKEGNLCFWLYVNDQSYAQNTNLHIELTSSGTADVDEVTWEIQGSSLKTGWNEICLGMLGGKKNGGNIDLSRVNYFRIWTNDAPKNLLLFLDAVRMQPMKTRVASDGMILSCDTMSEMGVRGKTNFSITTAKGEYKEGTGAVKGVFKETIELSVNTYDYIDISDWSKEALHFWLYVDDVSRLGGDLRVELGSAGTYDVNEHQWWINTGSLHNGWNDINMSFASAHKSKDGGADFSKICWLRIYNVEKGSGPVTMILDDVRAVKRVPVVREKGVILDCDSPEGIASGRYDRITNKAGEYKEGTGAFKILNLGKDWFQFVLEDPVDISEYKNGALHFWLYIEDANVLNDNLRVELGSGGQADVNEFQWTVNYTTLKTGWNEITLDFSVITKTENRADLSKINWFRIYWNSTVEGKYAILDDVRAVQKPPKEKVAGMILDCDNLEGIASGKFDRITTEAEEHKEGTGAFKILNLGMDWFRFVLEDPVDISAYEKGSLHFWLYIEDILKLQKHDGYLKQYYHTNGAPDTMLALLRHSDSYIWLILCSVEVIENSGDKSLYEYMVEYSDSPVKESVLTHLQKAADYMFTQTGEHGLCLMLDGDWNDPVNGPGHLGKGESTWNSMALAYAVDRLNEACYSEALHIKNEKLKENINEYCWDGEWYLAGIDDEGIPYGSHNDEEGQRFLNAQTWAIISGVAKEERLEKTIRTIESLKNDYGYVLIDPAFSKYNAVWGRVSQKIMGTTENGSVYNHAVMFKAYADMINGDPDRAMETIQLTLPTNMERFPDDCCGFPLFYSNFYFGQRGDNYGRTSQHYRTGTVAWCLWLVIKQFFGIHISTKGVDIKPAFPKEWKEAEITFRHNEDVYEVKMSEQKVEMYKNRIKM